MRSIKGPKSALTDYIEENKINLKIGKKVFNGEQPIVEQSKAPKKAKKVNHSKPIEMVNLETVVINKEDSILEEILNDPNFNEFDDNLLNKISLFLSRKRKMTKSFFDFLVDKCDKNLFIYDCSMIKNVEFNIVKNLHSLLLNQCGQLTETSLNYILCNMPNLHTLRLAGGFLIENFNIPPTLKILDVYNCSRMKDVFISQINSKFKHLEELRLSCCYSLTSDAKITVEVDKLFICETKLTENFYSQVSSIRHLSIKSCPNINSLRDDLDLEYLDAGSIVTLKEIPKYKNLTHLNIAECKQIKNIAFVHLEYLNISNINLTKKHLNQVLKLKKLQVLDVSWNTIISDQIVLSLSSNLNLKKIFVFGCFGLTQKTVDLAYKIKETCQIIGIPSETSYLLNE